MTDASISPQQFKQILEVTRMLAVTTELDKLLAHIALAATTLLDCERASIFLYDEAADQLCTTVAIDSDEIRVPSRAGIVGHVFQTNTVLHVPQPYQDPRFNPETDKRSGFVTRNLLTAPMSDLAHKPLGVIQAVNSRPGFSLVHEAVIQLLADQAGVAIQRYRLQKQAIDATNMRREMELASRVQQAMIPDHAPKISGIDAIGWTKPASITGGDTFDLWETRDGRLGIFVADASGHGLGPAMVVSQTRTLVRALTDLNFEAQDILSRINARLNQDLHGGSFITAFLGFLAGDGKLNWASAGQGPILIRADGSGDFEPVEPTAPPLGIVPDFDAAGIVGQLNPGGMLAVLSDGVLESRSPSSEFFTAARAVAVLQQARSENAQSQSDRLRRELSTWQGSDEPADDQTIVLVRLI